MLNIGANSPFGLDKQHLTPLYYAIQGGNEDVVNEILKVGGMLQMTERQVATELCIAAAGNHVKRLKLWHAAGVDMDSRDMLGTTCLHVAVLQNHQGALCVSIIFVMHTLIII